MAEFTHVLVGSGQTRSAAFIVGRSDHDLVVEVPSLTAACPVGVVFSVTSGGEAFSLMRSDGSGSPFLVHSGAGPAIGIVPRPPTPWGQLTQTAMAGTTSYSLFTRRPV